MTSPADTSHTMAKSGSNSATSGPGWTQPEDVDPSEPRIGPNSVVQTLRAIEALESQAVLSAVTEKAGLPEVDLGGLIPEDWFIRLVRALRSELPPERSELILERSGRWTAEYVRAHRIPGLAQRLLALLPARVALPLLLLAIRRHAWTFAGAGRFEVLGGYPGEIVLENAPTCRTRNHCEPNRGFAGGRYYAAAFESLVALAAPGIRVREVECLLQGDGRCRFVLERAKNEPIRTSELSSDQLPGVDA